ncbi:MAG: FG-GAP repeat protein, partial [Candidatus Eisenbacteria bacterium]|nr:FG-GAP repeat protein [Candidatus Eisenbacteria bacterium]
YFGYIESQIGVCRVDNIYLTGRGLHDFFSFDGGPRDFPASGTIGPVAGSKLGFALGSGDVNGDGVDDLIAGAPFYSDGETNEGAVFVYLGSSNGTFTLDKIVTSNRPNAYLGVAVAGVSDVDGDGYDDVLVGAPYYSPPGNSSAGGAFLYRGGPTGVNPVPVWSHLGSQDAELVGLAVASAGDVNHDGYGDVIIGAPGYDGAFANQGEARVFLGSATGLSASGITAWAGQEDDALAGWAVAGGGDLNGDVYDDVLVGIPSNYGLGEKGTVIGVAGAASGMGSLADGWIGLVPDGGFGSAVAFCPNEGDLSSVAIGSPNEFDGAGIGAIYLSTPYVGVPQIRIGPEDDMTTENGSLGSVLVGADFNGDGYGDVLAGAPYDAGTGGRAVIFAGGPQGFEYGSHPIWSATPWSAYTGPIDFGRGVCALKLSPTSPPAVAVSAPDFQGGVGSIHTYLSETPGWEGWTRDTFGPGDEVGVAPVSSYGFPQGCGNLDGLVLELHDSAFQHPEGQAVRLLSPIVDVPPSITRPRVHLSFDRYVDSLEDGPIGFVSRVIGRKICPTTGLEVWEPVGEYAGAMKWATSPCGTYYYETAFDCETAYDQVRVQIDFVVDCDFWDVYPTNCVEDPALGPLFDNIRIGINDGERRFLSVFVFQDTDGDGSWWGGALEPAIPGVLVSIDDLGLSGVSNSGGSVKFYDLVPDVYSVSVTPPPGWAVTNGNPHTLDLTTCVNYWHGDDFGLLPIEPQPDLNIVTWIGRLKPGFDTYLQLSWQNVGTTTEDVTVSANLPPEFSIVSMDPPRTGGTDHQPLWYMPAVPPLDYGFMWIKLTVDQNTPIGTELTSWAQIDPITGDVTPGDNFFSRTEEVVGAFDPNEKAVSPEGEIAADETLDYIVYFQNLGTAEATNIVVTDELDPDLDIATLIVPTASSHASTFSIDGRTLEWSFEGINLPPASEDELGSQGFVAFRIKPRSDLAALPCFTGAQYTRQ